MMNDDDPQLTETLEGGLRELSTAQDPFRLLIVITTGEGCQAVEFGPAQALTVGRTEPADLKVAEASLSRLHARLTRDGEMVRVSDLGSRNGTWFLGERVREAVLRPGDAVVLGAVTLTLQVAATAGPALLGVHSASAILRTIEEEWIRARTFRRPLAVLALRPSVPGKVPSETVARVCLSQLRPVDRAGFYDRHTMLVLLPEASAAAALERASALCGPQAESGALLCGVADFPEAATTPEQLVSEAFRALREATSARPARAAPPADHVRDSPPDQVVRRSPAMLTLARMVKRVASRPLPVLVTGETGTGKELVARELHEQSDRAGAPLKVVNCAAIPNNLIESVLFGHEKGAYTGAVRQHRGVFEQAHKGTVFLDEVGELTAEAQAALLRVLDNHRLTRVGGSGEIEVDVRVVTATHRDLKGMSEAGTFRLDLFHRLNVVTLVLPPLRERPEEIEPLAQHFLQRTAEEWSASALRLDAAALRLLRAYSWPGNVRELRNVVERAVALAEADAITPADLPSHIVAAGAPEGSAPSSGGLDLRASVLEYEAKLLREALRRAGGNQRRAAKLLHLPLRTFQRKLSQLGITASTS